MYTQSLARALVRSGRRTIVVTMALGADSGWSEESDIEVLRLPCRPLLGGRYPVPHRDESYRKSWSWLESQAVCGVVVNTRFYLLSCDGLRFAKDHHVTPVLIEHGSAHLTMGNPVLDAGVQLVEHALTARCKRFPADYYAVSAKASAWLSHFGIASCGELSNAIDADEFCQCASNRDFRAESLSPSSQPGRDRSKTHCAMGAKKDSIASAVSNAPMLPRFCGRRTCSACPRGRKVSPPPCSRAPRAEPPLSPPTSAAPVSLRAIHRMEPSSPMQSRIP